MPKEEKSMILIAEDDEVVLRALYLALHDEGFSIATANDGEAAYTMTERIKPDLVLLDLLMPKKNGFEYLENLRANTKIKDTPVIVLSNLGDKESLQKAQSFGIIDYYIKAETDLSVLVEKINKALEKK